MAYGLRYTMQYNTINPSATYGVINIYQQDYAGAVDNTTKLKRGFSIDGKFADWDEVILGKTLEFTIINDKANYFELIDLMYAAERKYQVVVTHYQTLGKIPTVLFSGFLDVGNSQQKYFHKQELKLVASSHLKKLEGQYAASIDILQDMTFIDIISDCLDMTGMESNILVWTSGLLPVGSDVTTETTTTFLNLTGINTEVFWKNDVDRKNAFEVIETILTSFSCYIFWWDGNWYIEHYNRVGHEPIAWYIQYVYGQRYSPTDTTSSVNIPPGLAHPVYNLPDLTFIEMTQTLSVQPGAKLITVELNLLEYFNLTVNDFTGIPSTGEEFAVPPVREWLKYDPINDPLVDWTFPGGAPYKTMTNAIGKILDAPLEDWLDYETKGLYTTIRLNDFTEESSLSFKWKMGYNEIPILETAWDEFKIHYQYSVRITKQNGNVLTDYALWKNPDGDWLIVEYPSGDVINYNEAALSTMDSDYILDISHSIPIGQMIEDSVDFELTDVLEFTLCIAMSDTIEYHTDSADVIHIMRNTWYGDVIISTNAEKQDNVIEGTQNQDFVDEKSYTLDIFDSSTFAFKNGILMNEGLFQRTTEWNQPYSNAVGTKPLVDWFLYNKFRIYNLHRRRLTGTVSLRGVPPIVPFTQYNENRDGLYLFLATRYRFFPIEEEYEIQLDEYDNTTEVNLGD